MLTNKELARIEPRAFVNSMLRDFDRLFGEGWAPFVAPSRQFGEFAWTPTLEVVEKNQHLVARFELPGLKKEEIAVTVTDEGLRVEGERKVEEKEKEHNWYRTERTYGKFVRTIPLPAGVNAGDIKATFENGVLEVVVPVPRQRSLRPHVRSRSPTLRRRPRSQQPNFNRGARGVFSAACPAPKNSARRGKTPHSAAAIATSPEID